MGFRDGAVAGACAFVVLVIVGMAASKAGVFVEVGAAEYNRPEGSLWQQEFAGYPTQWSTRTPAFRAGVEGRQIWQAGPVAIGGRIGYFDLGKYAIAGEASNDEDGVVDCRCQKGETHWYMTQGSMRGISFTVRPVYKNFFAEFGATHLRHAFKLNVDTGHAYEERKWGRGSVYGFGYDAGTVSLGLHYYSSSLGTTFDNNSTPSGVNHAIVASLGFRF